MLMEISISTVIVASTQLELGWLEGFPVMTVSIPGHTLVPLHSLPLYSKIITKHKLNLGNIHITVTIYYTKEKLFYCENLPVS